MRVILDGNSGINFIMLQAPFYSKSVKVLNATIPISFFNVNQYNNTFTINKIAYVIPIGQYNIIQLITKLNSMLSGIAICSFNKQTLRLTITPSAVPSASGQFSFCSVSAGAILGFNNNKTIDAYPSNVVIGSKLVDLSNNIRSLYLRTNLQTLDLMINQTYQSGIFRIPISDASFGDIYDYCNNSPSDTNYNLDSSVRFISYELLDSNFNTIDFNGSTYQIELHFNTDHDIISVHRDDIPSRTGGD